MSTQLERLAVELLGLPVSSRALLAKKLIESLDETETPDAEALWLEVAKRRAKELEEGVVQGIPAEEVMRRVREILQAEPEVATDSNIETLGQKLLKHAGKAVGLPHDLAENHDHYLYGTPNK